MAIHFDNRSDELVELHEINVTSFIDVILVLLIIFMVAAPLATGDVPVNLPFSTAPPQPQQEKPVCLTLKADGSLMIGDDPVLRNGLAGALAAATASDKRQRIFLRGDRAVPYGDVMQLLNDLRGAGYLKVALVGLETRGRAASASWR